ncbi:hypothetical protein JVU11DRAFT_9874 [Chiua virens]|nr:hypothetical protein JVU11DRAFT_9874 [Chiua virens]
MLSSAIVSLVLAASALANVYINQPVSSTTFTAGQQATVTWIDSGDGPSLTDFGSATFGVYVGNALQQTPLQMLGTVNVAQQSSLTFTPQADIGPNSNEYFIRVTSLSLKTSGSPQYPEEAFSAKFTLAGMSGSFNASVQAQIDGQSTAPIGPTSTSSSPSATGSSAGSSMTPVPSSSASLGSSSSSSAAAASASAASSSKGTNGAGKPVIATGFVGLVAALIGASLL